MFAYSFLQWLLFFYLYSLIGWCFESVYVSIKKRRLINRGFIRGPFLPLYGSGAIVMLFVSRPFSDQILYLFLAGMIGATLLEYITGVLMESLFKVRYWDYSNLKFNYQGQICLSSSIAWGGLTVLMTRVIHQPIEQFVFTLDQTYLSVLATILTILIGVDFALSFRAALDLRDILIRMEHAKEELVRMQKRLDVMIAVLDNTKNEIANEIGQKKDLILEKNELWRQTNLIKTEDLYNGIEDRLSNLKKAIQEKPGTYVENVRDEIAEIRGSFGAHIEKMRQAGSLFDFHKRNLILGNPTMKSKKYNLLLEELKKEIESRRKKK